MYLICSCFEFLKSTQKTYNQFLIKREIKARTVVTVIVILTKELLIT